MAITTSTELVRAVCASRLLDAPQQDVLVRQLQRQCPDLSALLRALVERGWLTAFQVKQLAHGKGDGLIVGPYVLLDLLGEGGMGRVFKARQRKLNRIVALKVIRKEWLSRPDAVGRFQREIRSASKLTHPNIVLALDAALIGETYYIAMEYAEGIDLAKLVKQSGPLPVDQACAIAYQAALGLQHAHECGLVHRDIKPSNLLVTGGGWRVAGKEPADSSPTTIKILDMGLARATHATEADGPNTLTHAGVVVGTPDFISPEQARDSHTADIRSDIYSLGCTLYYMLAGRAPFPGGTGMEKLFKHQLEPPTPIEQLRPGLPGGLAQVVGLLMAKKPTDRPQTPADAARALRPFLPENFQTAETPTERKTPRVLPRLVSLAGQAIAAPFRLLWRLPGPRWRTFAVAAFLLLALGLAGVAWFGGFRPGTGSHGSFGSSGGILDQLDAGKIAAAERLPDLPAEVVAVLGEQRFRHWGMVLGAAFSPDGKSLATTGTDRQVRVWNLDTGVQRCVVPIDGPNMMAAVAAFTSSGQSLAVLTVNTSVKVWDIATGRQLDSFPNPRVDGKPLALAPDGQHAVFLGSGGVKLWDLAHTQERGVLAGTGGGWYFVFSQDGKTLAGWTRTGGAAGELRTWDVATGRQRLRQVLNKPGINAIAVAADGQAVAVLTSLTTLEIIDAGSGAELLHRELPVKSLQLAFAPGAKTLAISAMDRLRLHDVASGKEKDIGATSAWGGMAANMTTIFAPDGQTLAVVGGMEARARLWNVATGQEIAPSAGTAGWGGTVHISPDGATLASSFGFGRSGVQLWDPLHAKVRARVGESVPGTALLAFSADGRSALLRSPTSLSLWDTAAGTQKASVTIGTPPPGWFAVASFGGHTVFTFQQQTGKLWDGATLQQRAVVEGLKGPQPNTIVFSADGTRMAVADFQGGAQAGSRVRLWDAVSGKELPLQLPVLKPGIASVALSADGRSVAASSMDGNIKMWDAVSGKEQLSVHEPPRPFALLLRFAPGGATLLGWNTQSVKLWDTASKQERPAPKELRDGISSPAFAADGRTLAMADTRGRITLWNVDAGHSAGQVQLPGNVFQLTFAADGRHLATSNSNGTIYVLRVPAPGS